MTLPNDSRLVDQINAAPEPLRSYIRDLETNPDPTGNIRRAVAAEENVKYLLATRLPRSLTAENGMKGLLSGEFYEEIEIPNSEFVADDACFDDNPECEGCEQCSESVNVRVMISWTNIKAIYKAVVNDFHGGVEG